MDKADMIIIRTTALLTLFVTFVIFGDTQPDFIFTKWVISFACIASALYEYKHDEKIKSMLYLLASFLFNPIAPIKAPIKVWWMFYIMVSVPLSIGLLSIWLQDYNKESSSIDQ